MNQHTEFNRDRVERRLRRFPGVYECHITAALEPDGFGAFEACCAALGAGALIIRLAAGETPLQPMLCKPLAGDATEVTAEVGRLMAGVAARYPVTRLKLEAAIGNGGVPRSDDDAAALPADCYFEHHVKIALAPDTDLADLRRRLRPFAGHLSRNAVAARRNAQQRFVTQRFADLGLPAAAAQLEPLLAFLRDAGLPPRKVIREYNIYDSNAHADAGWADD